jgi:multidrug efflux pump subunit AcrB
MKIAEFSVRNYQFTIVIFLMLVALGASSLLNIPKQEDPAPKFPGFGITAIFPGASPTDVEQLVAEPIESRLGELQDVKIINSAIDDGLAFIRIEFEQYVDSDEKYDEVLREVNRIRPELPSQVLDVDVVQFTPLTVNIVQIALVSENASYRVLADAAEKLEKRLETVKSVREATTWAYPEREVRVALDLDRLAQLRIPVGMVLQALQGSNQNIPGGSVDMGARRMNLKTTGNFTTLEEVQNTVVGGDGTSVVRLRDVAEVAWGYADMSHLGRFDGRRAVFITANQKEGQTVFQVRNDIYAQLDRFEQELPANVRLERGFDQSENVAERLRRLGLDFAIAILLVLLTLLPLGWRASVVVMISIPLSLAMGVALLHFTGYTLNQLSIVGFVIALGLLVDDSIVVVENITRFLRMGYSRRDAAIYATQQIGVAVLGCTATLLFAFLPLLALPGGPGDFIRSLPLAVVYTIVASLIISLTIIPFLGSLVLSRHENPHGNVFLRVLNRGIETSYGRLLHGCLAHPVPTVVGALLLFAASLTLIPGIGFSLFPNADTPQFRITIEAPNGASLAATDRAARFVDSVLASKGEVRHWFTNVGRDNPRIYYNQIGGGEQANIGGVFVQLHRYDPKTTPGFYDSLRTTFATWPGARIEVKPFEQGPPIDAPIAMRIVGEDLDTLRTLAGRIETIFATTPGTIYVNNPVKVRKTDLRVEIDRDKAGLLGVPVAEAARTVRLAAAGLPAGSFREADGDEYDLVVRLPGVGKPTLEMLDRVYVNSITGAQVPLKQIAQVQLEATPTTIQRYNKERAVTITARVQTGYNTDAVTKQILTQLDALPLPTGYEIIPAGEIESRQESFGGLGTAIIVAVFMVLAVLVLEFRTFKSTLIVASVIPLGIVGGLVALWLTGYTLSFTSLIGFIALIGIEIKNSILLVDFTNQLRAQGVALDEAIEQAGEIRFLPIVLTTLTALGGLLPLAIQGSSLYSPLAIVIMGGLISSTLLARLVTPVMYKLLAPSVEVKASPGGDSPTLNPTSDGVALAMT